MCGIFGYDLPGVSAFKRGILASTLARLNDERGGHSWGAVGVTKQGDFAVVRGLGDMAHEASELAPYRALFAHTRFATHGKRTIANAHPFEIGRIIGAHNGVLSNHGALNKAHGREFEVDSMHLIAHLDEGLPFDDIEGYGTIVWAERDTPSRINVCRLAGGELSVWGVGTHDACSGIIFSSEDVHVAEAMELAGIVGFEYDIPEEKVHYIEQGKLYQSKTELRLLERFRSWSLGEWTKDEDITALDDPNDAPTHWDDIEAIRRHLKESA